jgi:hypothetical protein
MDTIKPLFIATEESPAAPRLASSSPTIMTKQRRHPIGRTVHPSSSGKILLAAAPIETADSLNQILQARNYLARSHNRCLAFVNQLQQAPLLLLGQLDHCRRTIELYDFAPVTHVCPTKSDSITPTWRA